MGCRSPACAGWARALRKIVSVAPLHNVQQVALPTHPQRVPPAPIVPAAFNYGSGRVLTRVRCDVRVMQPRRRHDPQLARFSACEQGDVHEQDAGGVVPQPELTERRSRRAGSFHWWLGVSSCASEAMPRSCACSCSV